VTGLPIRAPRLQDFGAFVRVRFGVGQEEERVRRERGIPVPEPLELVALVDTGASLSVLPSGTFGRLGILPAGTATIQVADGERRERPSSPGRLHFRGQGGEVAVPTHAVEAPHPGRYGATIGRDALVLGRLSYDGREGVVALTLRGVEVAVMDPLGDHAAPG